jgi:hypothetical protein
LRLITDAGLSATQQDIKSPTLAAVLNILPGIGNFYLAAGTEETHMWAIGAVNLLFWPVSVLWGVPEGAIDASTINKKETIYYYYEDGTRKARATRSTGSDEAAAASSRTRVTSAFC